jgi:hypothetical protein
MQIDRPVSAVDAPHVPWAHSPSTLHSCTSLDAHFVLHEDPLNVVPE